MPVCAVHRNARDPTIGFSVSPTTTAPSADTARAALSGAKQSRSGAPAREVRVEAVEVEGRQTAVAVAVRPRIPRGVALLETRKIARVENGRRCTAVAVRVAHVRGQNDGGVL